MRNLIRAGLMAISLLPAAAQAQYRDWGIDRSEARELHRDRADIRDERRDLDRAYRYGDRREIRDARDDYRDARREYRDDYRDARRDWGHDRRYYGHHRAGWGQRWVRARHDLLLVDARNGRVHRVIRNYYR